MALTDKLSAIGNAIRAKTGGTELLTLDAMPNEIASIETGGGGGIQVEPIVLTGNQEHGCTGIISSAYINLYGDTITTKDMTSGKFMFHKSSLKTIPFSLNFKSNTTIDLSDIFSEAVNLEYLPKINNLKLSIVRDFARGAINLKEIPKDYFDNWDLSYLSSSTNNYTGDASYLFYNCRSLRSIPVGFLNGMNPKISYYYSYYYSGFNSCYCLDELIDLPIPYTATWTNNAFSKTFSSCARLKRITFATQEDGSLLIKEWKNQVIDLSEVGWGISSQTIVSCNNSITMDKYVDSDEKYQALKNDPDWFTYGSKWSRYNKTSAIETINSLPDTSAYLATAGGTNTIKFKGGSGSSTDGGAINTMTEEEIAVATAKGWTVTFVP